MTTSATMFEPAIFVRRENRTYRLVTVIPVHISSMSTQLNQVVTPANISASVVSWAVEPVKETACDTDLVTQPDNATIKMIVNTSCHV